jgi:hypothetical protein
VQRKELSVARAGTTVYRRSRYPAQARWCLGREGNLLILKMRCRFAIRAAEFGPETEAIFVA